ncbi:hypothetical protein HanIR_Chr07g0311241 [Helianthus annuus]|nr:hypothetical protein HanIR_Chr07g0311241 [Helianthus annuus]
MTETHETYSICDSIEDMRSYNHLNHLLPFSLLSLSSSKALQLANVAKVLNLRHKPPIYRPRGLMRFLINYINATLPFSN